MVNGIPIFKVEFAESLLKSESSSDNIFGYVVEANKGPVNKPVYVASNLDALKIFGVDLAPHFYQKGGGVYICRTGFEDMKYPSIVYKAKIGDQTLETTEVVKVQATTPGTAAHQVNIVKSPTSSKAYNLTITIEGVGSKKYQNLSTLENVVKKINSKFAEYLKAELLFDEAQALQLKPDQSLIKNPDGTFSVKLTADVTPVDVVVSNGPFNASRLQQNIVDGVVQTTLSGGSNGKLLKTDGSVSELEIPDIGLHPDSNYTLVSVVTNTPDDSFVGEQFYISSSALSDGQEIHQLYVDNGETPAGIYVKVTPINNGVDANYAFVSYADPEGQTQWGEGTVLAAGTGTHDPNPETTLLYSYRKSFEVMEEVDLLGITTLSDAEVVQNELIEHINKMIDPEVYQYRIGVTAFLGYPKTDNGTEPVVDINRLVESTSHIDNPFVVMIGQGVIFEQDGVRKRLLPYECIPLYTGLRSALKYGEAIFGGNPKKTLIGVADTLPLVTDGSIITKEDLEAVNEAGLMTFKKEYNKITFLEGVTTAQDNPVLSHESVVMIVIHVLKRLIRVSKPFQGENVTEDLKTSLINALSNELKNITDTDGTLVALEDYNIPPYNVEVQATVIAGFNDAGEYVRESHYLVTVKIVPIGALRSITLSVIVI